MTFETTLTDADLQRSVAAWRATITPDCPAGNMSAAGRSIGLMHSTMARRLRLAVERGLIEAPAVVAPARRGKAIAKAAPPADWERQKMTMGDEIRDLRRKLTEAVRADLDAAAYRAILGSVATQDAAPPAWLLDTPKRGSGPEVPVTIWSDWHAGERVSLAETNGINTFDLDILERRVKRLVERTVYLLRHHGPGDYPGIVVNLLGDFISGGIHPELAKTDEAEQIPVTLRVRDILVWALDQLIAEFGRVFCPCAVGNHARNTVRPEFKRKVFNSFDWMIYELLVRHYQGNGAIQFLNADAGEALYRVFGRRYLATHGDMLGVKGGDGIIGSLGPIMRGAIKVGKQQASMGRDYDRLLMGHWHQMLWLPGVIVANSLKGYDEYCANALRVPPSTPSQPLWLVHPKWGETMMREVLLEDPPGAAGADWVSWKAA